MKLLKRRARAKARTARNARGGKHKNKNCTKKSKRRTDEDQDGNETQNQSVSNATPMTSAPSTVGGDGGRGGHKYGPTSRFVLTPNAWVLPCQRMCVVALLRCCVVALLRCCVVACVCARARVVACVVWFCSMTARCASISLLLSVLSNTGAPGCALASVHLYH